MKTKTDNEIFEMYISSPDYDTDIIPLLRNNKVIITTTMEYQYYILVVRWKEFLIEFGKVTRITKLLDWIYSKVNK